MESTFMVYSTLTEIKRIYETPELSDELNIESFEFIGKEDPGDTVLEKDSNEEWEEGDFDHKRLLWMIRLRHETLPAELSGQYEDWSDVRLFLKRLRKGGAYDASVNYGNSH